MVDRRQFRDRVAGTSGECRVACALGAAQMCGYRCEAEVAVVSLWGSMACWSGWNVCMSSRVSILTVYLILLGVIRYRWALVLCKVHSDRSEIEGAASTARGVLRTRLAIETSESKWLQTQESTRKLRRVSLHDYTHRKALANQDE